LLYPSGARRDDQQNTKEDEERTGTHRYIIFSRGRQEAPRKGSQGERGKRKSKGKAEKKLALSFCGRCSPAGPCFS
jgi:hypothetical protein